MILNDPAVISMAQAAADYSNTEQTIYKRKNGSYIYCAKGNFNALKAMFDSSEQVVYVGSVKPSYWPKEEQK